MKINDITYNKHFRQMILQSICCGLHHPVEWVVNYNRAIGESYDNLNEIEEFCSLTVKDLYASMFCVNIEHVDITNCNNWINNYYEKF